MTLLWLYKYLEAIGSYGDGEHVNYLDCCSPWSCRQGSDSVIASLLMLTLFCSL